MFLVGLVVLVLMLGLLFFFGGSAVGGLLESELSEKMHLFLAALLLVFTVASSSSLSLLWMTPGGCFFEVCRIKNAFTRFVGCLAAYMGCDANGLRPFAFAACACCCVFMPNFCEQIS